MIKCPCLLTQLYIKNVELCYSNLITYKSNHLFFHSYNIGFCSMQRKCQLLCYICGVAAHFYCHAFCSLRYIAHCFFASPLSFWTKWRIYLNLCVFFAPLRENKKAKPYPTSQTKNHANKNGLKLLKHNVVLWYSHATLICMPFYVSPISTLC
jgi:hypothetical protein